MYWFELDTANTAIEAENLEPSTPHNLPDIALEKEEFESVNEYYASLKNLLVEKARQDIERKHGESQRNLINAVRTFDELVETKEELEQRIQRWNDESPIKEIDELSSLRELIENIENSIKELDEYISSESWSQAPNLSNIAGHLLTARLIEKAGGLRDLALMSSSKLQVLGAEDALFQHIKNDTPPPKHGVIYMHPYVRKTKESQRGSASRMLAGKLSIAARVDYFSGDLREELAEEVDEKIHRIRERG